jgi:aryl-alcohol dehydrogenase-like predicted oxidoreductase
MRYLTFGRTTGLRVSEYALGTGGFGTRWGYGAEPDQARTIFERFAEAGGTFIDTADAYQFGRSEEILGGLLGADRDSFVLATKFSLAVDPVLAGKDIRPAQGAVVRPVATGSGRRAWAPVRSVLVTTR